MIADPDRPTTAPCPCGCVFSGAKSYKISNEKGLKCLNALPCKPQSLRADLPMLCLDINSRGARTVHPLSLAKMKNIIVINVCFPLEKIHSTCVVITKCVWFLALKLVTRLSYCKSYSPVHRPINYS